MCRIATIREFHTQIIFMRCAELGVYHVIIIEQSN